MIISIRLVSSIALAMLATQAFSFEFKQGHPVFQVGGFMSSKDKPQNIHIQGLVGDSFNVSDSHRSNALFGIGYFLNGQEKDMFDEDDGPDANVAYGINAFYFAKTSVSGTITQEQLFTNLAYQYDVTHFPIYAAATARLIKNDNNNYNITLDMGIGPNFIHTSHYQDHSLDGGVTLPDNAFSGHVNVAFSAMAGVGLEINNLIRSIPLACGYRFFYLGQGRLSSNTNQLQNILKTGNNYTNTLMCTVTI